jgi:hypothetical protein
MCRDGVPSPSADRYPSVTPARAPRTARGRIDVRRALPIMRVVWAALGAYAVIACGFGALMFGPTPSAP